MPYEAPDIELPEEKKEEAAPPVPPPRRNRLLPVLAPEPSDSTAAEEEHEVVVAAVRRNSLLPRSLLNDIRDNAFIVRNIGRARAYGVRLHNRRGNHCIYPTLREVLEAVFRRYGTEWRRYVRENDQE